MPPGWLGTHREMAGDSVTAGEKMADQCGVYTYTDTVHTHRDDMYV